MRDALTGLGLWIVVASLSVAAATAADRPNVIVVITDDQGYGDIGAHGNTAIRTPHLDQLHAESVRLTNFHVDPTCAPTRSALMTGRYSTRTGIWHTIQGRSLMEPGELTLGELFAANGYATGMFGKWHLGDNFPSRPEDQGFQTVLRHGGGGVTQTPDWWGNDYFDDVYIRENGQAEQFTGYCTDVWFREALKFIERKKETEQPFFCYIATNAPHGPYLVDDKYRQPYLEAGVSPPQAAFYGMITNIDENLGLLRRRLADWKLAENTILIFMTDNGSAMGPNVGQAAQGRQAARRNAAGGAPAATRRWTGYNAGMRGQKGSEYDGGHRVPFFLHWPKAGLTGGRDINALSAHIDVLPTLLDLCRLQKPEGPELDGRSLAGLLRGADAGPQDRVLLVHSQRMEFVEKWRKSAVMTDRWRLINGTELYDIQADPEQKSDIASAHGDIVQQLRGAYESWWESLSPAFDRYVRIGLGSDREPVTHLTCHDWHTGDKPVPWSQSAVQKDPQNNGFWAVEILQPGTYEFTLRMRPAGVVHNLPAGAARLKIGERELTTPVAEGDFLAVLKADLQPGPVELQTWLEGEDGSSRGAYFVDVRRLAP